MAKSLSVTEVLRGVYKGLGENAAQPEIVFPPKGIPAPVVYTDDDGECVGHHVVEYRRAKVLRFAGREWAVALGTLCTPTGFIFDEDAIAADIAAVEVENDLGDKKTYIAKLAELFAQQHRYKASLIGGTKDGYVGVGFSNPRSRALDDVVGREILGAIVHYHSGLLIKIPPGEVKYLPELVGKLTEAVQVVLGKDASELTARRRS